MNGTREPGRRGIRMVPLCPLHLEMEVLTRRRPSMACKVNCAIASRHPSMTRACSARLTSTMLPQAHHAWRPSATGSRRLKRGGDTRSQRRSRDETVSGEKDLIRDEGVQRARVSFSARRSQPGAAQVIGSSIARETMTPFREADRSTHSCSHR